MTEERWYIRLFNYYPIKRRKRGRLIPTWKQKVQNAKEDRALTDDIWSVDNSWDAGLVLKCQILPIKKLVQVTNFSKTRNNYFRSY